MKTEKQQAKARLTEDGKGIKLIDASDLTKSEKASLVDLTPTPSAAEAKR